MNSEPVIKQAWLRLLLFIIVLIALSLGLGFLASYLPSPAQPANNEEEQSVSLNTLIPVITSIFAALITVAFFRKVIDRKSISSLGLRWKGNGKYAATGFFVALFLIGAGALILLVNKNLQFSDLTFNGNALYIELGLMVLIALAEELTFRGYMLNTLLSISNRWIALVISAIIFALMHASNPGISVVPMINVFLAGLLLGLNYMYTRNLWFSILLHFGWNFYQGPMLGFRVSGLNLSSIVQQDLSGNPLLTGGTFGLEGSVIESGVLLVGVLSLAWIYEKKFIRRRALVQAA